MYRQYRSTVRIAYSIDSEFLIYFFKHISLLYISLNIKKTLTYTQCPLAKTLTQRHSKVAFPRARAKGTHLGKHSHPRRHLFIARKTSPRISLAASMSEGKARKWEGGIRKSKAFSFSFENSIRQTRSRRGPAKEIRHLMSRGRSQTSKGRANLRRGKSERKFRL